jgi:hypothetical protein
MTSAHLNGDEETLYSQIPDGGSVGNKTLRGRLGWTFEKYFDVRNQLVDKGLLVPGRGKGGSVARVHIELQAPAEVERAEEEAIDQALEEYRRERDLYPRFKEVIEREWVRDQGLLPNVVVEITASQGARETGGRWSRPDIVAVAVRTFEMLPGKHLDVTTFEVKPADVWDNIACVFEAAAHSRAATQSFLAIHTPSGVPVTADAVRVFEECRRFGIGLLTFDNPANYDTYETHVEPQKQVPSPALLDSFLSQQMSEECKKRIRLWSR